MKGSLCKEVLVQEQSKWNNIGLRSKAIFEHKVNKKRTGFISYTEESGCESRHFEN